jgi:hypothetical protein
MCPLAGPSQHLIIQCRISTLNMVLWNLIFVDQKGQKDGLMSEEGTG